MCKLNLKKYQKQLLTLFRINSNVIFNWQIFHRCTFHLFRYYWFWLTVNRTKKKFNVFDDKKKHNVKTKESPFPIVPCECVFGYKISCVFSRIKCTHMCSYTLCIRWSEWQWMTRLTCSIMSVSLVANITTEKTLAQNEIGYFMHKSIEILTKSILNICTNHR